MKNALLPIGCMVLCLAVADRVCAAAFEPDLGEAAEWIDGRTEMTFDPRAIPPDAPERITYPMATEHPLDLLTEVPGKPFRQVDPPPRSLAWWKHPFYLALGLPRDLADSVFGALSFVPVVSLVTYTVYEVVPTQIFLRDPRDWHRWPGRRNKRGHGQLDSVDWGWFPSAHTWHFTYESKRKLRRYNATNETLNEALKAENRHIEQHNQAIADRRMNARAEALAAIEAGDGREATSRMVPYLLTCSLDEGSFALLVNALALYRTEGPGWVAPLLWNQLSGAQPRLWTPAADLLVGAIERYPGRTDLWETLVYIRLLQEDADGALAAAEAGGFDRSDDPLLLRLAFETALTAGDVEKASVMRASLDGAQLASADVAVMDARLALAAGEIDRAEPILTDLHLQHPEDAYLNYYLGCVEWARAENETEPTARIKKSFDWFEKAVLMAPAAALRLRASRALAHTRSVLAELAENPPPVMPPQLVEP